MLWLQHGTNNLLFVKVNAFHLSVQPVSWENGPKEGQTERERYREVCQWTLGHTPAKIIHE